MTNKAREYMTRETVMKVLNEVLYQESHTLPDSEKDSIVNALSDFIYDSIRKYVRGSIEHGDNLESRDLPMEIYNETIDLFWYNNAMKLKQR